MLGNRPGQQGFSSRKNPIALNLNFLNSEILDSRITFARADLASCATRFNESGLLEVMGANEPRFDYDPADVLAQNLSGYSEQPWLATLGGGPGIATSLVGQGADNISGYADFRIYGTASIAAYPSIRLAVATTALSVGQQVRAGGSFEVLSGASPKAVALNLQELNSAGAYLANIASNAIPQAGVNFITAGGAAANPLCARLNFIVTISLSAADVVDITIRIRMPQANYGLTLLSYMPTYGTPVTVCAPKGLLIEESRTNKLTFSGDPNNAVWSKGNSTVGATTLAPDGTTTARFIVENIDVGLERYFSYESVAKTASAILTFSMFLKVGIRPSVTMNMRGGTSGDGANATFNLTTGVVSGVGFQGAFTAASASNATNCGNGWWRCAITATSDTALICSFRAKANNGSGTLYNGDGSSAIAVWGAQFEEAASFPTSYIPTTTTAVTRAADGALIGAPNFLTWFNPVQGSFVAEFDCVAYTPANTVLNVHNGGFNERMQIRGSSAPNINTIYTVGGSVLASPSGVSINAVNVPTKVGFSYASGAQSLVSKGGAVTSATAVGVPAGTTLAIGSLVATGEPLNGHIRSIQYYNTKLSDAQLKTLTA